MAYKTRFREVSVPRTLAETIAIGYDANSSKSIGAAMYLELRKAAERSGNNLFGTYQDVVRLAVDDMIDKISGFSEGRGTKEASANRRQLRYMMEGIQRAAKAGGDAETVSLVSDRLTKLGQ